uniref:ATXR3 C-terminal domain-containing protein n=1 Tax=Salix viminalis TaxID=40686 RepID=A0A6N2MM71_SALVM
MFSLWVRYVMRCIFGDPKQAPPPLEKLAPEETVSFLWKGNGPLADELLQRMSPYMDADILNDLRSKVRARDPSDSDDIQKECTSEVFIVVSSSLYCFSFYLHLIQTQTQFPPSTTHLHQLSPPQYFWFPRHHPLRLWVTLDHHRL